MSYIPDLRDRIREGVQRYESQIEDLERAGQHAEHQRGLRRSRRWLWIALAVIVVLVVLFVLFQLSPPPETPLPGQ